MKKNLIVLLMLLGFFTPGLGWGHLSSNVYAKQTGVDCAVI